MSSMFETVPIFPFSYKEFYKKWMFLEIHGFNKLKIRGIATEITVNEKILNALNSCLNELNNRLLVFQELEIHVINSHTLLSGKERLGLCYVRENLIYVISDIPVRSNSIVNGKRLIDESFSGVIHHEIGHLLERFVDKDVLETVFSAYSEVEWKEMLSDYSSKNYTEMWAESVAAFLHPSYGIEFRLLKMIEEQLLTIFREI